MGCKRTRWRPNGNSGGALVFAGMATGLACNLLAACAVGPDFEKPAAPETNRYTRQPLPRETTASKSPGGGAQHLVQDLDIPAQWWETFHSRPLNSLIEDALRHNADLQAARAALRVAQANAEAGKGAFYPQVGGNYNSFALKVPAAVNSPGVTTSDYLNLHTVDLDISYAPDIFGLVRLASGNARSANGG